MTLHGDIYCFIADSKAFFHCFREMFNAGACKVGGVRHEYKDCHHIFTYLQTYSVNNRIG